MKPITINVQISKCPKQYESIRLGGDWTLEEGETEQQAMSKALAMLEQFYAEHTGQKPKTESALAPAPAKTDDKPSGKTPLKMETDAKTIEQICKRIESGVKLETVLMYYELDADAMKVLELAAEMNKK